MKSLETLNLCKNRLTNLPLELEKSTSLAKLLLNDNDLNEIPTKIMSMQSLRILEAERELHLNYIFSFFLKCFSFSIYRELNIRF